MVVSDAKITDCKLIVPDVYRDFRGEYVETWNEEQYANLFPGKFVQDDISVSKKNTLRGFHGDPLTWKLVQCLHGAFVLAVLDVREGSRTCGQHEQFTLSDQNRQQVLIPAGCANGHLCLTETCIFSYKQTAYYDPKGQFSYRFDSANLKWPLPAEQMILSDRDSSAPRWVRKDGAA